MTQTSPASPHMIEMLELDEHSIIQRSPDIEAERAAAIRDLLHSNNFRILGDMNGPYYLRIGLDAQRQLAIGIRDRHKQSLPDMTVSLKPVRRLIKDYFMICESYTKAFRAGDTARLETIDMARRGLHDEGAEILRTRLEHQVEMDLQTARCLFTLICILHIGVTVPW